MIQKLCLTYGPKKHCFPEYHKVEKHIVLHNLHIRLIDWFPTIYECIKIDNDLYVQLQYRENSVPLSQWFREE